MKYNDRRATELTESSDDDSDIETGGTAETKKGASVMFAAEAEEIELPDDTSHDDDDVMLNNKVSQVMHINDVKARLDSSIPPVESLRNNAPARKSSRDSLQRFNTRRFTLEEDVNDTSDARNESLRNAPARKSRRDSLQRFSTRRFTLEDDVSDNDTSDARNALNKQGQSLVFHRDMLRIATVRSNESVLSILGPVFFIVATLLFPIYFIPRVINAGSVSLTQALLPVGLSMVSAFPAALFLNYCKVIMKKALWAKANGSTTEEEDSNDKKMWRTKLLSVLRPLLQPSVTSICWPFAMVFRQAQYLLQFYVPEEYHDIYSLLLNQGAAMFMLTGWCGLMDSIHGLLLSYARRVDSIAADNAQSKKLKTIMEDFRSSGSIEGNNGYAIPGGHRSAARVLAEITGIYCNVGKGLGVTLLLLFYLGVDLYTSLVALGLTVAFAGFLDALHINEAFKNVLSISQSNAIHVGEIISLARPGFTPGDNPGENVTGFVESFTWTHVIIRDFKRKATFIRHEEFGKLVVQNWSRRPSKHAHFIIPIVPELSGGADRLAKLAKFAGQWAKAHPAIDQDSYQKAVIKLSHEKGLVLEVIFFPKRGQKARVIRSEFVVMIIEAARRYNLCLMTAEVRASAPWPSTSYAESDETFDGLDDLLPSPGLTERAGFDKSKKA